MSYNRDYTITTLSASVKQYNMVFPSGSQAPIIPTGRIRDPGYAYLVYAGDPPDEVFPTLFAAGDSCYDGSWVRGKIGNYALKFDGTDDYVTIGSTSDFAWMHGKGDTSSFKWSVAFWMKLNTLPSGIDTHAIILNTNALATGAGFSIDFDDDGDSRSILLLILNSSNQTIAALQNDDSYPDDLDWHHVVVTFDKGAASNNAKIYMDGSLTAQGNDDTNTPTDGNSNTVLTIGANAAGAGGYFFPGTLDELAIWDKVLDSTDIGQLYNSGNGQPASNIQASKLVSYFNFEEGTGAGAIGNPSSAISGALNGTMHNMVLGKRLRGCT